MLKTFATATALSGLLLATAVAQSPPTSPSTSPSTPPAAAQPAPSSSTSDAKPMDKPMTNSEAKPTGSTSGTAGVIPAQKSEQWTASKFKGTDVMGSDNQKIGDVSDILFDRDAKIDAYIVSVGGFLGIGSKEVALAPKEFQVVPGDNGSSAKLKVNMNKEQLQQAANFQYYKEPVTTSSNTSSAPRSGGTMR